MEHRWRSYAISEDASHHVFRGQPAYQPIFHEVLKFHEPGLAPVRDDSGAYHITPAGLAAYAPRHIRTFGFYEGRAAVHSGDGWFHILPDGNPLYGERYAWCGNFQEGRCTVRLTRGDYFHITGNGSPAYGERYRYAGDFKDGHAVVQGEDGRHTHVDASGSPLHGRWFEDLDVFHKQYARACDSNGWHHVDLRGEPLYERRFKTVEPFYNGQARVEGFDGSLSLIDESGATLLTLRPPSRSALEAVSTDMVGFWRTQTIRAAVELGVFEILPATPETVEVEAGLAPSMGARLLRGLLELGLIRRDEEGLYHPTGQGTHLTRAHPLSLVNAALMWGREHYAAWMEITDSLRTGESSFKGIYGQNVFDWVHNRRDDLDNYHAALSSYARHDYRTLPEKIDFGVYETVLDAGGSKGELIFGLLRACPVLQGVVMDRTEVIERAAAPSDVAGRCRFVAGDLFAEWPVSADAIVLARVLHDWPAEAAVQILKRARAAIKKNGVLYLAEMVLDETGGDGGLLDLNMLVMTQGAERTERQFGLMLEASGFRMQRVIPIGSVVSVIEARPA